MNSTVLHCIDLDQPAVEGFRQFISAWLVRRADATLLVDPGPLSSIPRLVAELRRLGVERLDRVLLTHIHIDHAGGTGALLEAFPEARVTCHPDGIRHLVDPARLWQGSRQVLGELAEVYGEIVPVPAERIGFTEQADGVRAFLTPGHAPHHCCYLLDDLLFAGEVAGVHVPLESGVFMRPATPPRFMLPVALNSIDRMLALAPRRMVIAHYGLVEPADAYLRIGRAQLQLWVQGVAATAAAPEEQREAELRSWLLERDPCYRHLAQLPADIQAREDTFFANTLRGMHEYVAGLSATERQALRDAPCPPFPDLESVP